MRTPEEFSAGHVKGAQNIDVRQNGWQSKIDKLNPNGKYLVYCRTNHRSGLAVEHMLQKGFKNVYQMMDGYSGWAANSLPAEK
jgi:rhodanese-related sulfurtransferase